MFVVSQYLLKSTDSFKNAMQISSYAIVMGLVLYASVYLYLLFYNNEYLSMFNTFIIYIILVDLLLFGFHYYSMERRFIQKINQQNESFNINDDTEESDLLSESDLNSDSESESESNIDSDFNTEDDELNLHDEDHEDHINDEEHDYHKDNEDLGDNINYENHEHKNLEQEYELEHSPNKNKILENTQDEHNLHEKPTYENTIDENNLDEQDTNDNTHIIREIKLQVHNLESLNKENVLKQQLHEELMQFQNNQINNQINNLDIETTTVSLQEKVKKKRGRKPNNANLL